MGHVKKNPPFSEAYKVAGGGRVRPGHDGIALNGRPSWSYVIALPTDGQTVAAQVAMPMVAGARRPRPLNVGFALNPACPADRMLP